MNSSSPFLTAAATFNPTAFTTNPSYAASSSMTRAASPSSASSPTPSDTGSLGGGPARKRQRTDMSPEERKEARAHRNRIAAQHSRDKRKVEFSHLRARVTELEEENARLRAGHSVPPPSASVPSSSTPSSDDAARWQAENVELRERIKSLEKGWDAIIKALAAQGVATAAPIAPASLVPAPQPAPTATYQVPVPAAIFTTPAHSQSQTTVPPTPAVAPEECFESVRHLAADGLEPASPSLRDGAATAPAAPLARDGAQRSDDDSAVDALLAGLLALPPHAGASGNALAPQEVVGAADGAWAWEATRDGEEEMRRLLEMLPTTTDDTSISGEDGVQLEELDLDFDMSSYINAAALGFEPGVSQVPALGVF